VGNEKVDAARPSLFTSLLRMLPGGGKKNAAAGEPPTEKQIQDWIVARVAQALELTPDRVGVETPFARLGLDSRTAVGMSGELEKWLGRRLSPTLIWDFPTIAALARHLHSGEPAPVSADDLEPEASGYAYGGDGTGQVRAES
jgi:acyl carrier protein